MKLVKRIWGQTKHVYFDDKVPSHGSNIQVKLYNQLSWPICSEVYDEVRDRINEQVKNETSKYRNISTS